MAASSVAIVGASLAGYRCLTTLRRGGFEGTIAFIGAEPHLPYDRPPLSKQVLGGEWELERAGLTTAADLQELDVDWRPGTRATGLDVAERRVSLDRGSAVTAEAVVIATGAAPRRLPGTEGLDGVFVLRTIDDSHALGSRLAGEPLDVVVVGAGFIGAEVASTAAGLGHRVTVLEADTVPLRRAVGEEVGAICAALHRENGVDLRLGARVGGIVADASRVTGVELDGGERIAADVVVVGIGVTPNTAWLETSGLEIADGVVCDSFCEAAPGIHAAGDVARWENERFGVSMRVEHWDNAVEQGVYVAKRILGETEQPYAPVPWFWSDQYGHKIQLAGRVRDGDRVEIALGSPEENRFIALYTRDDEVSAVFGIGRPRQVMLLRQLIADGGDRDAALRILKPPSS